ncbi:hypothetical protein SAMN04490248_10257 [Salinihabitans flavidus]|uniref:HTH cro/C1-type domain-containing protein n=1 Tax=Salinihabitans flavidus TaxID=569882 RepID=A0A1H8MEZ6_9RHOB|nr:helix-turn-helix transcriptional regulator [Salinihabitans flavidus]SEO15992.1 hypothetical protein SAMN04490248_10257 [Salinihabitans flavidus]
MARDTITGSRIRERRSMAGIRQADLARAVGISPSYLNLIEHNRRRIGGKLLLRIADVLGVEPSLLSEGAEAALIADLREAAADADDAQPELERVDEFAGRFPGWAALLAEGHRRIGALEHTVTTLTDRLTHDPHLAGSMHEVLSMVTAVRSTAAILAETPELEPEWRGRFHRNINEDATRLAESSRRLVAYLDGAGDAGASLTSPQEEVEQMMAARGYHLPELETGQASPDAIVEEATGLDTAAARSLAQTALRLYRADAQAMPLDKMAATLAEVGIDPAALSRRFSVPPVAVFRRLAAMPDEVMPAPVGLVTCDGSGTLVFRKQIAGFDLPRFSAACPKWPLFSALSRPQTPIRRTVTFAGRDPRAFDAYAMSDRIGPASFDHDPLHIAYMLLVPRGAVQPGAPLVGSSCRVCPVEECPGRREPSILVDGI